jgi:hypothetical protein
MAQTSSPDTYSPFLLIHNVMRMLAADGCKPVLRFDSDLAAAKAIADLLRALGTESSELGSAR